MNETPQTTPALTVLYDGSCPMCQREIGVYPGLLSGATAFLALWAALPGWRWLALAGRLPGAARLMERTYRLFLGCRPMLQRWASRLDRAD